MAFFSLRLPNHFGSLILIFHLWFFFFFSNAATFFVFLILLLLFYKIPESSSGWHSFLHFHVSTLLCLLTNNTSIYLSKSFLKLIVSAFFKRNLFLSSRYCCVFWPTIKLFWPTTLSSWPTIECFHCVFWPAVSFWLIVFSLNPLTGNPLAGP